MPPMPPLPLHDTSAPMAIDYYSPNSLSAALYDIVESVTRPPAPEIAFYRHIADGPAQSILEIGARTGRVAIPLAEDGHRVHGLELSADMLRIAEAKREKCPEEVRERLFFHQGDMRAFDLKQAFNLVLVPFRTFNFLLTDADRDAFFACLRKHLIFSSRAVIDTWGKPLAPAPLRPDGLIHKGIIDVQGTNHLVGVAARDEVLDAETQTGRLTVDYAVLTKDGAVTRSQSETLRLRWAERADMLRLFNRHGFRMVAEYGGFDRQPPTDGSGDRIWVVELDPLTVYARRR